eukprot:2533596-Pyramimonas_sp.AAC.1
MGNILSCWRSIGRPRGTFSVVGVLSVALGEHSQSLAFYWAYSQVEFQPPQKVTPPPKLLQPIGVTTVTDPYSQAQVTVRQDLVLSVKYKNFDRTVMFADGTRLSMLPGQGITWQVSLRIEP